MIFDTEVRLIKKAKKNRDAFAVFYDMYFKRVYAFVASRVSSREIAEDLTSEIWIKILDNLKKFEPEKDYHVPAWVFRVARNHLTDYYRTKKTTVSEEVLSFLADDKQSPDKSMDIELGINRVNRVIAELPEAESEVISLRYLSELKNKEIAETLGIKERTVSSHLSRGLKRIRKILMENN